MSARGILAFYPRLFTPFPLPFVLEKLGLLSSGAGLRASGVPEGQAPSGRSDPGTGNGRTAGVARARTMGNNPVPLVVRPEVGLQLSSRSKVQVDLLFRVRHRAKPSPFRVSLDVVLLLLVVPNDVKATVLFHLLRRSKIVAERKSPAPFEAGFPWCGAVGWGRFRTRSRRTDRRVQACKFGGSRWGDRS